MTNLALSSETKAGLPTTTRIVYDYSANMCLDQVCQDNNAAACLSYNPLAIWHHEMVVKPYEEVEHHCKIDWRIQVEAFLQLSCRHLHIFYAMRRATLSRFDTAGSSIDV